MCAWEELITEVAPDSETTIVFDSKAEISNSRTPSIFEKHA